MPADGEGWLEADDLLEEGAQHRWPDGTVSTLQVTEVRELAVPTGRIMACDPGFDLRWNNSEVLLAEVAPGAYPVSLSLLHWTVKPGFPEGLRLATAAMVTVRSNPVVSWEGLEARGGGLTGLGVDAGVGCFYDAGNRTVLQALQADDARLDDAFDEVQSTRYMTVDGPSASAAVVLFDCGMGDGVYPVRIGRDRHAAIASVLIDLELLSHSSSRADDGRR